MDNVLSLCLFLCNVRCLDARGGKEPYSFLPFVLSAYFVIVGLMYSAKIKLLGIMLGTVWFPMLCVIPGIIIGILLKKLLVKLV
jgi:hypothetical protein